MDYAAANAYVQQSYGIPNYFAPPPHQLPEPVYNARQGVPSDTHDNKVQPATLGSCGFQLVHAPGTPGTHDPHFVPRARHALLQAYASTGNSIKVRDVMFWNPPRPDYVTTPQQVHIDMDVNAYRSVAALLDRVWSCRVPADDNDKDDAGQYDMWKQALQHGARFCITRVVSGHTTTEPPLGLYRTVYDNDACVPDEYGLCPSDYVALDSNDDEEKEDDVYFNGDNHLDETNHTTDWTAWPAMPMAKPSPTQSKWYTFPNVTADELLFFTQYDRDVRVTSDIWHCALTNIIMANTTAAADDDDTQDSTLLDNDSSSSSSRHHSFDMLCLVLLENKVPTEWDRWTLAHQMPLRPDAALDSNK